MKKKLQRGSILLAAVLLLAGVFFYREKENFNFIENTIQEAAGDVLEGQTEHPKQEDSKETDAEKLYEEILNGCKREFISNKPVDENFLIWFRSAYGEESLKEIAEEVSHDEQDGNLWYSLTGSTMQVLWLQYCKDTGYQSELLENVYYKDCADEDEVVLDFTGDINLAEGWSTTVFMDKQANGIYDCLSADLLLELQRADILMMNNEFTYSDRGYPIPGKAYTFRASPTRVEVLQQLNVDVVSLANNHVYDYGEDALLDTLETLEGAEIPYVGAGRNLDEAKEIVYFVANGRKIAIVSATQIERSYNYTKEATEDTAGVLKTLKPEQFLEVIREAKRNSDCVIVYPHWGTEGTNVYGLDQQELAEAYVEAGADVIVGGHTHCLQGIAYIEDTPVIYSLGNFWFNGNTLETGVAQIRIRQDGEIRFRFLPCMQSGTKTRLLTEGEEREQVMDFMRGLSKEVEIDDEGYVTNLAK